MYVELNYRTKHRLKSYKYENTAKKKKRKIIILWLLWFRRTSKLAELFFVLFSVVSFCVAKHMDERTRNTKVIVGIIHFTRERIHKILFFNSGRFHVQRSRHNTTDSLQYILYRNWIHWLTLNELMNIAKKSIIVRLSLIYERNKRIFFCPAPHQIHKFHVINCKWTETYIFRKYATDIHVKEFDKWTCTPYLSFKLKFIEIMDRKNSKF